MKNAIILHGTGNDHTRNWIPWLKSELEKNDYKVWTPDLPRADRPNIQRYNKFLFPKWKLTNESIIVGHSSGAVAALGMLQEFPHDIWVRGVFLVAGFTEDLHYEPTEEMFVKPFDWEKIKKRSEKFVLFHSDNDPYVPLPLAQDLQRLVDGELILMPGQAHFSTTTYPGEKYLKFPELLVKILE